MFLHFCIALLSFVALTIAVFISKLSFAYKWLIFLCAIFLAFSSVELNKNLANFSEKAQHTRFVRDLFHRLSELPEKNMNFHMNFLKRNFEFPLFYNEEGSIEQEKLLNRLISSMDTTDDTPFSKEQQIEPPPASTLTPAASHGSH